MMARKGQTRLSIPGKGARGAGRRGMTLIELILVMALLTVLLSITMPALSSFFRGRQAREEARRLLALTRFARGEAISRATPMELWINPEDQVYGLRPLWNTGDDGRSPVEFQVAENLQLEIDRKQLDTQGLAVIKFLPDGTIDEESLDAVGIRTDNEDEDEIQIERSDLGIGYSIR
jgi:prepilin-type N-terminal cleavage/methylation domain-containing protein